jgi:hypothetical protein
VESGDTGYGIFELDPERTAEQRREFMPIVQWVDEDARANSSASVIQLAHPRARRELPFIPN